MTSETTPLPVPRARAAPRAAQQSDYTDLARAVRASGLLARRRGYYWSRILGWSAAFAAVLLAVTRLGDTWWQLVLAAVLGVVVTQFGFLSHDAAHRQVFTSATWNDWASRILGGVFAGLSYGWWKGKHDRHHAAPNQEGRDPDIAPGLLAFTRDIAAGREQGARGWFLRHQGWLFFPLLTLEGLNLHAAGLRVLASRDARVRHRLVEAGLVVSRLVAYAAFLLVVLPPGKAAAFLAVQMAVFGVCLGGSFAPNHKGMPIVPPGLTVDYLRRQVLMSRNVRGSWFVDGAMGGLNYQIEHHLFPSMPRPNLRRVQPLVRAHCAEIGIPYAELGLLASYAVVIDYLNHVGLRARDPFDCPLAADLRS